MRRVGCWQPRAPECEAIDLGALALLPLYDESLKEDAFPAAATALKASMTAATGLVIACPEYNGSVTPLLLNAITWATRGEGPMYSGFQEGSSRHDPLPAACAG